MEKQVQLTEKTYKNIIESLRRSKLNDIANHLEENVVNTNSNNGIDNNGVERSDTPTSENSDCISIGSSDDESSREDNFHTKLQEVKQPLVINVKKATKFRDRPEIKNMGVYPMRSNPRGLVLIIANNLYKIQKDRRPSARHDESNLKKLFEDMGFKVITYFDLTGKQIEDRIKEFSQMPELRRVDSAFIIISSHGSGKLGQQETEILGVDYNTHGYKKVVCTKIIDYFTAKNCRNLSGKPKIFIFQTCRGKNEQSAVPRHKTDAAASSTPVIEEHYLHFSETMRNYDDTLLVYSTIPGYVSYRDEYNGSWFIQILCEVFMNYAHKVHLNELFNMIDYRLKNVRTIDDNCQTVSITSQGFNQYCFLNPGLFEDKSHENIDKNAVTFKCCPDRKANILICSYCESVYHCKCAKKLDSVKVIGQTRADCCSQKRMNNDNEASNITLLNENIELKKILDKLKEENDHLKEQMCTTRVQFTDVISNETILNVSKASLNTENLKNENELLKQLNKEISDKNQLLIEKNNWLSKKLSKKKKNQWVKKNIGKVLKRQRKRSNTCELVEP